MQKVYLSLSRSCSRKRLDLLGLFMKKLNNFSNEVNKALILDSLEIIQ